MTSNFQQFEKSLRQRWKPEWTNNGPFTLVAGAFNGSLNAVSKLCIQSGIIRNSGKYSERGTQDEIRAFAGRETVPVLKAAFHAVRRARMNTQNRRGELAMPTSDKTDIAAAQLRSEMRGWLRTMPPMKVAQLLVDDVADPRLLVAALEVPPEMIGINSNIRGNVIQHYLEINHSEEMGRLNELDRASETAEAALNISMQQLRSETGFGVGDQQAFDQWMGSQAA